jgi:L-iditol 2-dehydrogenase
MKACVLHAVGDLRYEEVPDPKVKPGEVLVKIRASGICGSDIGRVFYKGTYHFPTIPGHEFSGEIVEAGDPADKALVGRKAAVFPLLPCRQCDMCEVGEYASCRNYDYFGSRRDGGFAEYISVPVWNVIPVEDSLSFEEAAMAEPAAVSLHALGRAGVAFGDTVLIFGAGPIGLMLAGFARAWGALEVILLDVDEHKIRFAREMGHRYVLDSRDADYARQVMAITGEKGADVAVEGTGVSQALSGCLKCAKPGGKVVLMGNPVKGMDLPQNDYWEILRKQLALFGTWNSSYTRGKNDWQAALAAMAQGKLNVKPFVTHRVDLSRCNEAFDMIKERKEFFNKVMFVNA